MIFSGLAAAYKLKVNGLRVTLFESEERAGGKIKSMSQDGFIWDEGANTMTESETEVRSLIDDLGLREKQQFPLSQNKRYIVRNGMPQLIPSNPIALIKSDILSPQSKLKIIMEPFLSRRSDESLQESVGQFFGRHFGTEVVDYLIDPFVAGMSAGDPESLSMRHAFPELSNMEKKFGSIILGAIWSRASGKAKDNGARKTSSGKKKHQRGSFTFHGGMQAPLCNVQEMKFTKRGDPFVLDFFPKVNYLPLSVFVTSFKKDNVKKPLEGFGVLVPSKEQENGLRTLGTLFSSMMFPDRAPNDQYLYTTFVGGSRNKDLAGAPFDELKQIVTSDIRKLLGAEGQPTFVKHFYWNNAFPLYGHDYNLVLEAIDKMERDLPGFFYAGNNRDGLSVGKALASGCRAAELVISYLSSSVKQDA